MSKCPNWQLTSLKIDTKVRLNPHLGVSGDPFIKTMTGALFISVFNLALRSCSAELTAGLDDNGETLNAFCLTFLVKSGTSAPLMVSSGLPDENNMHVGTESIPYLVEMSGRDSAAI